MVLLILGVFFLPGFVAMAASQVLMDAALDKPVLLANQKQKAYLRVGLTGFAMEDESPRTPLNVAIVLDKSGSMRGEKIAKAREAAIMAIERLAKDDILSFVTYDHTVNVVIPATKVIDKEEIFEKIRRIEAEGYTALFGGVSKGAAEVRKFLSDARVNRVILLSDGLANRGPSTPSDLGELGTSLIKERISVTTIGLGLDYNEDLMAALALRSDGSHYFAEEASDLEGVFEKEFGRALSVVARDVRIKINCGEGVRPVRVLGRDYDVDGQTVSVLINDLYSEAEKFTILEMEVPPTSSDESLEVATVEVTYDNMKTKTPDRLSSTLSAKFSSSESLVKEKTDSEVMVDVITLITTEKSQLAMKLRDEGKIDEARKLFISNHEYLEETGNKYNSEKLLNFSEEQYENSQNLDREDWIRQRKGITAGDVLRVRQ